MPRKDENLSRYLSDMVRYGYWTNEELKRVQNTPMPPIENWSREYHLEAQVRHVRFQMQLDDINGMVYVVPHYACRPSHIQYQGKAYRRSTFDNDIAYPNNPDGIGCTNCRHEVTAYYRGIDKQYDESLRNTDELIKQYNDEQKMRYYERNIRKLKLAGEGNDESIRNYYAKMMKHSRDTNTPIQINRTWTISASRYNIGMPDRRLDMMNLLPRTTNESFDYGFVKTTARMTGKRKSYFIDGIDISEINFAPESIRTAYTGRAYGIGRAMTEDAYKSSLETLLHTSANSEGTKIVWADKTTTNLLNATGCFYIPKNTDVDSINPFDVYDDFKKYQTTDLLPTSYGIYVDDNGVWRFFYGDSVESDIIYDFSRKPNRQKVSPKIMDTPIVNNPMPETHSLQNTQHSKPIESLINRNIDSNSIIKHANIPHEDDLIKAIGGADKTGGSCASLSYVYTANKYGGWNVLDFRGGESANAFMNRRLRYDILYNGNNFPTGTIMPNMKTTKAFFNRAIKQMETDVEYWCTAGRHCAIMKKDENGTVWWLELQSDTPKWENSKTKYSWQSDIDTLLWRFGVRTDDRSATMVRCDAIDFTKEQVLDALTFINTDKSKQKKGKGGGIK